MSKRDLRQSDQSTTTDAAQQARSNKRALMRTPALQIVCEALLVVSLILMINGIIALAFASGHNEPQGGGGEVKCE